MAEIYCIVNRTVKLSEPTGKHQLNQPLAYDNSFAHSMRATVVNDNGTDTYLSDVSVVGSMLRADGNTVTPIMGSLIDGNVCEVILPASCYLVPGRFKFTMNLFSPTSTAGIDDFSASEDYDSGALVVYNGVVYRFTSAHAAGAWTGTDAVQDGALRTILWVEGTVERNISGTIIDPGTPVGNIPQVIANASAAAESATTAASSAFEAATTAGAYAESVAPDYDDVDFPIAAYSQLCWHDGGFYINNQLITDDSSWTSAHWDETDISTELAKCVKIDGSDIATLSEAQTYLGDY